jgi:hypothetical protein
MHEKEMHGRQIKCENATGKDRSHPYASTPRSSFPGGGDRGNAATSNLFVANIPSAVEEDDLYNHFEKFGKGVVSFCFPGWLWICSIVGGFLVFCCSSECQVIATKTGT